MLGKILKYDLKYIFKGLSSFYFLTLLFAVFIRVLLIFENSTILKITGFILSVVLIISICSIIVNNIIRLWMRFAKNIFGDESYLTHTLPVEKSTIYTSKFLSSIVSFLVSFFVIIASLFIAFYSKSNFEQLRLFLNEIALSYDSNTWRLLASLFFVYILEMLTATIAGFTGLLIGHRYENNKMARSIFWGVIVFFVGSLAILAIVFGLGFFNKDIMDLFFTNQVANISTIKRLLLWITMFYMLLLVIYYIYDLHIFKKGVNVD